MTLHIALGNEGTKSTVRVRVDSPVDDVRAHVAYGLGCSTRLIHLFHYGAELRNRNKLWDYGVRHESPIEAFMVADVSASALTVIMQTTAPIHVFAVTIGLKGNVGKLAERARSTLLQLDTQTQGYEQSILLFNKNMLDPASPVKDWDESRQHCLPRTRGKLSCLPVQERLCHVTCRSSRGRHDWIFDNLSPAGNCACLQSSSCRLHIGQPAQALH